MKGFIGSVATYNANPFCVDEEMAKKLFEESQGILEEILDFEEYADAVLLLDIGGKSPKHIYKCGYAIVCLKKDLY